MARRTLGSGGTEVGGHRLKQGFPIRTGLLIRQLSCSLGPLAHPEEQGTFNPKVPGSRPGRPTSKRPVKRPKSVSVQSLLMS
jgi:hypothetical protein